MSCLSEIKLCLLCLVATGCWYHTQSTVVDPTCSSNVHNVLATSGAITSYNYPGHYLNEQNCIWRITAYPASKVVKLNFNFLNTEACCDFVRLYDGFSSTSKQITSLSGSTFLASGYSSTQRYMYIEFTSDGSVVSTGFNATFLAIRRPVTPGQTCSPTVRNVTAIRGSLTSHNYPSNYPNLADCRWRIVATSSNKVVTLTFNALNTEACCDYVRLFDGFDSNEKQLASLSGSLILASGYSTTQRYMFIQFTSDESVVSTGFNATYVMSSPTRMTTKQSTTTPFFVSTTSTMQTTSRMQTTITSIRTYTTPFFVTTASTGRPTSTTQTPALNDACNPSTRPLNLSSTTGFITSPLYPSNYPHNADCQWTLMSPDPNRVITLRFTVFNTEIGYDRVTLYDGIGALASLLASLDGYVSSTSTYSSTQRYMVVRFTSDLSVTSIGFNATYTSTAPNNACASVGSRRCVPLQTCIESSRICNTVQDCPDDTDEVNCTCRVDQYQCANGRCINRQWLCDGVQDCPIGDDEASCNTCQPNQFRCRRGNCISTQQRCDGVVHCPDSSDEANCLMLNNITNPLTGTYRGVYPFFICADNWTPQFSDSVCRQLGHTSYGSISLIPTDANNRTRWLRLVRSTATNDSLLSSLIEGDCPTRAAVGLTCITRNGACGRRSPNIANFGPYIVNGQWAQRGAWPWQVKLELDSAPHCGGSLINDRWVLTAAHCVEHYNANRYSVRLGSIFASRTDPDLVVLSVDRVFANPLYDPVLLTNDVGLLRLTQPVTFTDTIRPICLPTANVDLNMFKVCVSTGFGRTSYNRSGSSRLLQARMDIRPLSDCYHLVAAGRPINSPHGTLYNNTVICLGTSRIGDNSNCMGDSGGPLACQDPRGTWTVVGVTSFGSQFCSNSVDARVSSMVNWILQTMDNNST